MLYKTLESHIYCLRCRIKIQKIIYIVQKNSGKLNPINIPNLNKLPVISFIAFGTLNFDIAEVRCPPVKARE